MAIEAGVTVDDLKRLARTASSLGNWLYTMEQWIREAQDEKAKQ